MDALVRYLDETGPGGRSPSAMPWTSRRTWASVSQLHRVPLADGGRMFVSARRPFLAELEVVARRRGVDAARVAELYDTSTGLLDRLLLAFVAPSGRRGGRRGEAAQAADPREADPA